MGVFLEPSVIASLCVSLIIALLSKRLARFGEYLIDHLFLVPMRVKTQIRLLGFRRRKELILDARSYHKVTWSIVRTYTFLIFFSLAVLLYLLLIAIGPLKGIGSLPKTVQMFIAAPIFVFEILWLLQKDKAKSLIRISEQRVTNRRRN